MLDHLPEDIIEMIMSFIPQYMNQYQLINKQLNNLIVTYIKNNCVHDIIIFKCVGCYKHTIKPNIMCFLIGICNEPFYMCSNSCKKTFFTISTNNFYLSIL